MKLKDIAGYEGLYKITDCGDVISTKRRGNAGKASVLVGGVDNHGYKQVTLTKNGKGKTHKVHKLVANAFVQNPHGHSEINHKDENKLNNSADNLEWCTRAYNVTYGARTEKTQRKVLQYSLDGEYIATHNGIGEASRTIGAKTCGGISNCCKGKCNTAYGYKWR